MTRDRELQALVDKADRERDREREREIEREAKRRASVAESKPTRPKPAVTFTTYTEIDRRNQLGIFWWFSPMFVIVAGIAAWFTRHLTPVMLYVAIGLGVVAAMRIALRYVTLRRGYRSFLRFPGELSYSLTGWGSLIALGSDPETWASECTVTVRRAEGADEAVIAAIEDLFRRAANGWWYTPDGSISGASSDPRKEWTRDGERLVGSVNLWVVGEIYRMALQLDRIHRKVGGIAGIEVARGGGLYGIPRPHNTGD